MSGEPHIPSAPDFRLVFEAAPDLLLLLSPDFTIVAASRAFLRASMRRREDLIGLHVFTAFPDDPADPNASGIRTLRASLERVVRERVPDTIAVFKYDIPRPEAEGGGFVERYWQTVNLPVLGPAGEVAAILHRTEDVTEYVHLRDQARTADVLRTQHTEMQAEVFRRAQEIHEANRQLRVAQTELERRADDAVREGEGRYRELFHAIPQPMWVFDAETLRFLAVNDAAVARYGWSQDEFLAMSITDIRPPEDVSTVIAAAHEAQGLRSGVWRHRWKSGQVRQVEVSSHNLTFANRPARLVLSLDITDKLLLEEQFRQAQKMEAVGTLAGGVAHDFNNLLTIIAGYSDILLSQLAVNAPDRALVEQIKKAGDRAASLTRQLLSFSRQQVIEPKVLDPNAVIRDTVRMLRRLIGEDITLTSTLSPTAGRVRADVGQLEQVILNLVVNARDAMPEGGSVVIETAAVELDAGYTNSHMEVVPGRYVMLAVSDTGHGMTAEVKARVFEPFFTTKAVGKGTGLGLATVYGIVKQSGGHVWVYSEPGHGTTFKLYFPQVVEEKTVDKPTATPTPTDGGETILLVEDDDGVRVITAHILTRFGYTVLAAAHGREAVRTAETHPGPIHLLMTDVVMPEMGGRKVAEAVLAVRPGIKLMYLSGYTNDAVVRHGIQYEHVAFLQKPFSAEALGRKVREVLAATP